MIGTCLPLCSWSKITLSTPAWSLRLYVIVGNTPLFQFFMDSKPLINRSRVGYFPAFLRPSTKPIRSQPCISLFSKFWMLHKEENMVFKIRPATLQSNNKKAPCQKSSVFFLVDLTNAEVSSDFLSVFGEQGAHCSDLLDLQERYSSFSLI